MMICVCCLLRFPEWFDVVSNQVDFAPPVGYKEPQRVPKHEEEEPEVSLNKSVT